MTGSRTLLAVAVAVAVWTPTALDRYGTALAQSSSAGAISGVVRDAVTQQPIPDAIVQLHEAATFRSTQRQFTDPRGRFVFVGVPDGREYSLSVIRPGYFNGVFGASSSAQEARRAIRLQAGQWFSKADIFLWRHGSISGRVIDEAGEPCIGVFVRAIAIVRASGRDRLAMGPLTATDDRGRYRLPMLPPGRYTVFVPSVQSSSPATATVAEMTRMSQASIDARRQRGEPLPIDALLDVDERTRLTVGKYPVPPPVANGRVFSYPMAFSGNSPPLSTSHVTLAAGEDIDGVDVQLIPVASFRVSGVVDGPPDARANLVLRLVPEGLEQLGAGAEAATALTSADGSFVFASVPSGRYTIEASLSVGHYSTERNALFYTRQQPAPTGIGRTGSDRGPALTAEPGVSFANRAWPSTGYWGRTSIAVGATDVPDIVVSLIPALALRGRFILDLAAQEQAASAPLLYPRLESASGDPREGIVGRGLSGSDGHFTIAGIGPGRYLLRETTSSSWMIKSVIIGGRDVTHVPIDTSTVIDLSDTLVTVTNAVPVISGTVTTRAGVPAGDVTVIVFPADRRLWVEYGFNPPYIRAASTSTSGVFRMTRVPAGTYFALAVQGSEIQWHEPDFFEQAVPFATRLSVDWGKETTVHLRLDERR